MFQFKSQALFSFFLILSAATGWCGSSASRTDQWFFGSEKWSSGVQLNARYLGHLGSGPAINAPPGGIYVEGQYGVWWEHFLEGHIQAFKSVSGDLPFMGFGAGLRLNVIEFSKANALEFSGESTAMLRCIETRRGLLSPILRSFLVHADVEYNQFFFNTPDSALGTTYSTSPRAIGWGGGVQWGPNLRIQGLSRMYVDTAVYYSRIAGAQFVTPYAGLGINF